MFSDIFFTFFHDFLLSVTEKRASPRSLKGGRGKLTERMGDHGCTDTTCVAGCHQVFGERKKKSQS